MRIAVTGGRGRVGRAVIDLALSQGHDVVSIDRVAPMPETERSDVQHIQAELTDYEPFERALHGCEALVHLAAIPSPHNLPDYVVHNNNVTASYNALSAAARLGINRVCQASSINAIGAVYSRWPRYDYFPLDERHPTYNEDPYSLSKWICELQGDSFARRYEAMTIASLRFHGVIPDRATAAPWMTDLGGPVARHLWGYVSVDATARSCLLAITADFSGHEVFYIVAPDTATDVPSLQLKEQYYPDVPIHGDLNGNRGFFNTTKAEQLLGWSHNT